MGSGTRETLTAPSVMHDALLLLQQVWDTPSIAMKLPFATPSPSRRPSEAGSHVRGSEAPEHPWGLVLSQFATVARHDPRNEVCCVYDLSTSPECHCRCVILAAFSQQL